MIKFLVFRNSSFKENEKINRDILEEDLEKVYKNIFKYSVKQDIYFLPFYKIKINENSC